MRLPIAIPKYTEVKTEEVDWPTVAFAHNMAKAIAKEKKKKKRKNPFHDEVKEDMTEKEDD